MAEPTARRELLAFDAALRITTPETFEVWHELLTRAAGELEELERIRPHLEELWPLLAKARSTLRAFAAAGARDRHPLYVNAERDAAAVVEDLEELEPLIRYGRTS